ncbi:aminotransferase class I/II-fold pyridoxal phosphate-dependent enzyme [Caballeronia sp. 15715]|uniref:aminotransferase class I/II-fold pyridoxal phosphate-dependent enzyme n=1 Tax=Caballeronia sp. 15715 TaxID=3391030 RepID=UPI0039E42F29
MEAGGGAYVGTFSKFPELRVGYVAPPASLHEAVQKAKQISDWHSCSMTQAALAKFMLDGDFAKHLRRMHQHYKDRRRMLVSSLQNELAEWFEPRIPAAGIHMTARLKGALKEKHLTGGVLDPSIGLYGISGFYMNRPTHEGLIFGYGGIGVDEIGVAMKKIRMRLLRMT